MIYLDNAATSYPKAPNVAEEVYRFLIETGGNIGRSSHKGALEATSSVFETRELLADLLGVKNSEQIIFTLNATQAINTVLLGLAKSGDSILTSTMEHNAVMRPLRFLQQNRNVKIDFFRCDHLGYPDLNDYSKKLKDKPAFVISTACSNVTGTIFPYQKMAEMAQKEKIPFLLDASQLIGYIPTELDNIDAIFFPGHKGLLAPPGTGGFYFRDNLQFDPLFMGGTGSSSDSEIQPDFLPDKYESGTPNIAGLAGLRVSLMFIQKITLKHIRDKKMKLFSYFWDRMKSLDAFTFFGIKDLSKQIGIISVVPEKISISEFTQHLNDHDIAVRMGLHCAPLAHKTIGTFDSGGTVRFSPGFFTTKDEIDETIDVCKEILVR